ncbi:hypothetical protein CEXT_624951 [Caerostris extrusa]|uniref:Uncharacterized protein n=1 Tax=Caerostris extrusa TaxID=172846 RepID=A0AAV4RSZ0_CAEEX|nr:hypothetical protein CEXT_624951 [Caerostris extrusa]
MQVMGTPGFRSQRPFISRKAAVATKHSGRDARLQARRKGQRERALTNYYKMPFTSDPVARKIERTRKHWPSHRKRTSYSIKPSIKKLIRYGTAFKFPNTSIISNSNIHPTALSNTRTAETRRRYSQQQTVIDRGSVKWLLVTSCENETQLLLMHYSSRQHSFGRLGSFSETRAPGRVPWAKIPQFYSARLTRVSSGLILFKHSCPLANCDSRRPPAPIRVCSFALLRACFYCSTDSGRIRIAQHPVTDAAIELKAL